MRISGLTKAPTPEDINEALTVADDYAAELKKTLDIGWQYPASYGASNPNDNSGISREIAGPFKKLLSRELLSYFGKPVPALIEKTAKEGMRRLEQLIVTVAPAEYPGTLPYGSGNEQPYRDRKFYPEPANNRDADYVIQDDILNWTYDFTDYPNWLIDDTLATVEWNTEGGGIDIANVAFTSTTTSAQLTFSKVGGYAISITATKSGSTDRMTVTKNFIIQGIPQVGMSF